MIISPFQFFMILSDYWFNRTRPSNPRVWHKWNTPWPVILDTGDWWRGGGTLWRRLDERGSWIYTADPPTEEEISDKQW